MSRLIAYILITAVIVVSALNGCSSDDDTPLGASFVADSLINSEPGEVFTDTLEITGDFSTVINSFATGSDRMSIGSKNNVLSSMIIRFDLSAVDTNRIVASAVLSLREVGDDAVTEIAARFFELLEPVDPDDEVPTLMLADTIPDDQGSVDRTMQLFPSTYALSPSVVQGWVGARDHNGIAVVINEPDSSKSLVFGTSENGATDKRPFLTITYTAGADDVFLSDDVIVDGTFFTDQNVSPPNAHAIADGETRRIFFPIDLSEFDTRLFLHDATLTVYFDSLAGISGSQTIVLYAPESTDPDDPGFLEGVQVSVIDAATVPCLAVPPYDATPECEVRLRFPIKSQLEEFLADPLGDYGFVLRYTLEGSDPRRMEFFQSTAAEFVRPTVKIIYSTPAKFPDS